MAERIVSPANPLALGGHVDDLPEIAVRDLRRIELKALTAGHEHCPIRCEGDPFGIMVPTRNFGLLAPDNPELFDPRLALPKDQAAIANRRTAGATRSGLGEAQIHTPVAGETGMRDDLGETALSFDMYLGHAGDLLLLSGPNIDQP